MSDGQTIKRDIAIDIVRGVGILMIGVDHLAYLAEKFGTPGFINPFVTWLRLGWSSAAEFFVFFSGYLTGIVYFKTLRTHGTAMAWARAAQRSWRVYVLNLLTLCAVWLLLSFAPFTNDRLNELSGMHVLMDSGAAPGFLSFLRMQSSPMFFEILPLYVVLLLAAPAIVLIARFSGITMLLLSFALWLVVQLNAAYGIAPALAVEQNFNPFGWQFMFVLGMLAGIHNVFPRLAQRFSRERLLLVSGSLLALVFVIKIVDRANLSLPLIGRFDVPGYDKPNLGPLQVIHFLISVVFVLQIVPRSTAVQNLLPFRAVARVGSRSLECFCLSTFLVYAALGLLAQRAVFDPVSLLIAGTVIVLLLCAFAPAVDWIDARPWRGPRRPKAAPEELEPASRLLMRSTQ